MTKIKNLLKTSVAVIAVLLLLTISTNAFLSSASGQRSPCDNGTITRSTKALPVILVHGYNENSGIWTEWEQLLAQNAIPFCTVTFRQSPTPMGDACGSAADHAKELAQIVQEVKSMTGENKVNIIGHSKGGLDARVYLAKTNTNDVANLIMIGTPNAGGQLADALNSSDPCTPAIHDLVTDAPDTMVGQNTHTNYYTIAGECSGFLVLPPFGIVIPGPNDGIVFVSSVESLPYSTPLGRTIHCHMGLLSDTEYQLAQPILVGR